MPKQRLCHGVAVMLGTLGAAPLTRARAGRLAGSRVPSGRSGASPWRRTAEGRREGRQPQVLLCTVRRLLAARLRSRSSETHGATPHFRGYPRSVLSGMPLLFGWPPPPPCLRCCSGVPGDPPTPLRMRATARMFRGICSPTVGQFLPWVSDDPPPCSGPDGTPGGGRAREGAGPTLARKSEFPYSSRILHTGLP